MTLFESRKLVNCKWAALSHTLDKIGSSDVGLLFPGSLLSADLRIGTISAFFHGSGKVLKVKDFGVNLSQPGALFELRLLIILCTSPVVMVEMQIRKYCLDRSCDQIRTDQIPLCHEC